MASTASYARSIAKSAPLARAGSITSSTNKPHPVATPTTQPVPMGEKYTIAKFATKFHQNFPIKFSVAKGFYGPSEDLKFSEGDKFRAHAVKQSTVVNIQYDNGIRENIPATSGIPFAILFDPNSNTQEAMKGYRFEKISELMKLPNLPLVLWSRKSYHGSSPETSVSANELLIVRRVKTRLVGKQQLKVYSHTQKKEKTLYTTCVGSFSTKPREVCLFLSDILKNMPDIFPCRAVMLNPVTSTPQVTQKGGACIVTLMHSSIDTSLVVSSTLQRRAQFEIPIDLDILVRVDTSRDDESPAGGEAVYEETSLYTSMDPRGVPSQQVVQVCNQQYQQQQQQQLPPPPPSDQFYTNVHFGQERSRELFNSPAIDASFASVESAIEQGHYQSPREIGRTPSDPIAIESVYHPSDPSDVPPNYVLLTKHQDDGFGGNSPGSPAATGGVAHSSSPSYRPPLPPPNRNKRDHRSAEYAYVETNPTRSTRVCNEPRAFRSQASETGDNGFGMATPTPDSAYSDKSFGSSGSGGATVDRRGSVGSRGPSVRPSHPPGSGDGVVERHMLRTSSVSSAGYSYAKTDAHHNHHPHHHHHPHHTQQPHPYPTPPQSGSSAPDHASSPPPPDLPISPHHYSHLRSRSGPPVMPQMVPLSTQIQAAKQPIATTRLDDANLVVMHRQQSTPAFGNPNAMRGVLPPQNGCLAGPSPPAAQAQRWEEPTATNGAFQRWEEPAVAGSGAGETSTATSSGYSRVNKQRPDSLDGVMDDLAKITQELIFMQDESTPATSPEDLAPPTSSSATPTAAQEGVSSNGSVPSTKTLPQQQQPQQAQEPATTPTSLPPEMIEQHKAYLKTMDNFQVLRLLEIMGLEQYTPIFKQEQINGDILSTCDDALLKDELKITSRLHRMRLLRVIEGAYSVHEIMSGKDGYIFMSSAGKQS